jgi:hypothetical protein
MSDQQVSPVPTETKPETVLPAGTKFADLKNVTLYQFKVSPPCTKMRAILTHYKVPFTIVNGKKKDSAYKKVPVLVVNGLQINDSFQMVKELAPILASELSEEDLAFEKQMTYGMQNACMANVLENGWNMRNMVGKWFGCGAANCVMICCCNCPCARAVMRSKKKKGGDKSTAMDVFKHLTVIEERLGDNDFLHGE